MIECGRYRKSIFPLGGFPRKDYRARRSAFTFDDFWSYRGNALRIPVPPGAKVVRLLRSSMYDAKASRSNQRPIMTEQFNCATTVAAEARPWTVEVKPALLNQKIQQVTQHPFLLPRPGMMHRIGFAEKCERGVVCQDRIRASLAARAYESTPTFSGNVPAGTVT